MSEERSTADSVAISLIAAVARNGCIGKDNDLPWYIPEDLQRFKALTQGQTLVMGRKTYGSILDRLGKPLPGRMHWVLTRQKDWMPAPAHQHQVRPVASLSEALTLASVAGLRTLWVIGGAEVYGQALPYAQTLEITEVGLEAQGDAFFPDWGTTAFKKAFKTKEEGPWQQSAQGNGVGYRFLRFKRKSSKIRIGAIVLAAGQGSRMGNQPKPLISVDGQPLITRILDQLRAAGVDHIGVVLGHYADQIMPIVAASDVQLLHNPAPGQGQASSQKIGLSWLPADCDAAMVVLADQPSLTKDDLRDLICRFKKRAAGVDMVYPVVDGSPGNPVMLSAVLAKFLAGQDPPIEGRAWRAAHQAACLAFETKNRHYIEDLDTDDDLTAFQAASGIALTRP